MAGYDLTFGNGGRAINDLGGVDRIAGLGAVADGKLIALSFVTSLTGIVSGIVIRYNADGSLDTNFNTESASVSVALPLLRKIIASDYSALSLADISKGLAIANSLGAPTIDRIRAKFNSVRFPYPIERLLNPESFVSNPTNFGDTALTGTDRTYTAIYDAAAKKVSVYRDITSTQAIDTTFGDNGKFVLPSSINFMGSSVSLSIVIDSQDRPIVSIKGIDDSLITVVRLNQNGSIDSTFGTNGKVQLESKIGQLINPLAVILNTNDRLSFGDSFNNDSLIAKYDISGKNPISAAIRNDFNGDGKSDILWRNNDGRVSLWQMNGSIATESIFASLPTAWKVADSGDFNGDKKSDILWRNDDGSVSIWQMDGTTAKAKTVIGDAATTWKIAGTGDFNGDSKSDILWRNDDGGVAIWQTDGLTATKTVITALTAGTDWKIAGTGDFNGDGKSDILWRKDDGSVALWQMEGINTAVFKSIDVASADWKIAGTGDFNGDGKSDILWRNNDGRVAIWQMDGATRTGVSFPYGAVDNSWKIAGTGDFNGDSKADILWRNDNGGVETWEMDGGTIAAASLVSPIAFVETSWKVAAPIL
jgi:hypothetical protein